MKEMPRSGRFATMIPREIKGMMRYIYCLGGHVDETCAGIFTNVQLFAVAGKYRVKPLQAKATTVVRRQLGTMGNLLVLIKAVRCIYNETAAYGGDFGGCWGLQ